MRTPAGATRSVIRRAPRWRTTWQGKGWSRGATDRDASIGAMRRPVLDLTLVAVATGGALGAWARLGLAEGLPTRPGEWPWATLLANLAGCALLGYASTRLLERLPPSTYRRPLIGTGLCGGLTTFSTLQLEVVELGRDGHVVMAVLYLAVSVTLGLAAVFLAAGLVRRARLRFA
jgi:CrcB protein